MLSVFIRWVVWFGRLLLVVSVTMYRCALMYRLIKLHTRGCVGSYIRLAVQQTHVELTGSNCLHSHGYVT